MKLVGKVYFYSDSKRGASEVSGKGKRPYYILAGIDNEYVLGIVSTTMKHIGKKNTYSKAEYIETNIVSDDRSLLRLSLGNGWERFKKNEVQNDFKNLKNPHKIITRKDLNKLLKFYDPIIKDKKNLLF